MPIAKEAFIGLADQVLRQKKDRIDKLREATVTLGEIVEKVQKSGKDPKTGAALENQFYETSQYTINERYFLSSAGMEFREELIDLLDRSGFADFPLKTESKKEEGAPVATIPIEEIIANPPAAYLQPLSLRETLEGERKAAPTDEGGPQELPQWLSKYLERCPENEFFRLFQVANATGNNLNPEMSKRIREAIRKHGGDADRRLPRLSREVFIKVALEIGPVDKNNS